MQNHTQNPNSITRIEGNKIKSAVYQNQQSTYQAETSNRPPKKQTLHALFNLVKTLKGKQAVVCTALTGEQATGIVNTLGHELRSCLLIKFAGMEAIS